MLLLETLLAFADKGALVHAIAAALRPGGRFACTLEEGAPLTPAERAAMPDADTVWLTPVAEFVALLERAGLVVTWQEDHSGAHRATAQALQRACRRDRGTADGGQALRRARAPRAPRAGTVGSLDRALRAWAGCAVVPEDHTAALGGDQRFALR